MFLHTLHHVSCDSWECTFFYHPRAWVDVDANHVIRVTVNATFKQLKGDLVKKSWDPRSGEGDKLYWLNGEKYEKLDVSSWSSIEAGQAKL